MLEMGAESERKVVELGNPGEVFGNRAEKVRLPDSGLYGINAQVEVTVGTTTNKNENENGLRGNQDEEEAVGNVQNESKEVSGTAQGRVEVKMDGMERNDEGGSLLMQGAGKEEELRLDDDKVEGNGGTEVEETDAEDKAVSRSKGGIKPVEQLVQGKTGQTSGEQGVGGKKEKSWREKVNSAARKRC